MFTQGEKLRFQADAPARRVSRFFLKGRYAPGFILRGAACAPQMLSEMSLL